MNPKPLPLRPDEVKLLMQYGKLTIARPLDPQPTYVDSQGQLWEEGTVENPFVLCKPPFGPVGQELYGQEEWAVSDEIKVVRSVSDEIFYRDSLPKPDHYEYQWRNPYTMPQWASRLPLINRGTVPKRVRDVAEEEILKLGIYPVPYQGITAWTFVDGRGWETPLAAYKAYWQSNYPDHPWKDNLWVWCAEFSVPKR